tara:strand:- start:172 stop:330 length:159 start_codon:yes stop_codon:yes gene_type:complete
MSNPKLFVMGSDKDFTDKELECLKKLIQRNLKKEGVIAKSFSFQIRVECKLK